jgi:DNA-binding cell septation regulator SpoVG
MSESRIIVDLKACDYGSLKAFADVSIPSEFGEVAIRGFRVIQEGDKPPWVGFPSSSYMKTGQVVRSPLLQLGPALRRQVVEAVLSAYEGERG